MILTSNCEGVEDTQSVLWLFVASVVLTDMKKVLDYDREREEQGVSVTPTLADEVLLRGPAMQQSGEIMEFGGFWSDTICLSFFPVLRLYPPPTLSPSSQHLKMPRSPSPLPPLRPP